MGALPDPPTSGDPQDPVPQRHPAASPSRHAAAAALSRLSRGPALSGGVSIATDTRKPQIPAAPARIWGGDDVPRGHTVLLMAASPPPAPWPQVPVVAGTSPAAAATPCCGPWGGSLPPPYPPQLFLAVPQPAVGTSGVTGGRRKRRCRSDAFGGAELRSQLQLALVFSPVPRYGAELVAVASVQWGQSSTPWGQSPVQ